MTLETIRSRSLEARKRKERFEAWASPTWGDIDFLLSENERLTRERNEALNQCAELHRQIAILQDDVERLARTEQLK